MYLFFFHCRRQRGKSRRVRRRDRYFRFEQGRAFDLEGEITAQRSNSSHHRAFDRKYYDLRCAHFRGERGHHHGGYFSRHQYQIPKSKVINRRDDPLVSLLFSSSSISSRARSTRCDSSDFNGTREQIVSKRDEESVILIDARLKKKECVRLDETLEALDKLFLQPVQIGIFYFPSHGRRSIIFDVSDT